MSGLPSNLNLYWCRIAADALREAGVRHALLTVGGRSAAMALALGEETAVECFTRVDERGAAFMALGIARTTGRPVAVVTTSGSAVANLLPALTEAKAWGTPLVLVTCDRPLDERGIGPQASDHMGLCAAMVAGAVDLPMPADSDEALARLRSDLAAVLDRTRPGPGQGPVHINLPQAGRVTSLDPDPEWRPRALAPVPAAPPPAQAAPDAAKIAPLLEEIGARAGMRGLIVAGPDAPVPPAWIAEFADATGFPVLADASSGLRRPAAPNLVALGDILVLSPTLAPAAPELVVQVGTAPVSHTLHAYIRRHAAALLAVVRRPEEAGFLSDRPKALVDPSRDALRETAAALAPGDEAWRRLWLETQAAAEARRERALTLAGWGDAQAAAVACAAPGFDFTLLANSMPARLGNLFCTPSHAAHPILCSRGVNGIDGTLGTFLGALVGHGGRGLAIVGDQAMLHDLPSLEPLPERPLAGCICLLNNKGPGIFDLSIWPENPVLRGRLRRRTTVDFGPVAAGFGMAYERVGDAAALAQALQRAATADGLSLVEADLPEESLMGPFGQAVRTWIGHAG